ncbi:MULTISPECIES: hypothetical protein [Streptomyces]|uniref:Uncharacterized protein n=1 Tax=Streptomyces sp. JL1001 TaxID=3078227 RepID=A0AAU8KG91_9ACTN|nr:MULTISPECIES: hypothetical protein [unclassified Streptomyces]PJN34176.1 hypothetical protein CG717_06585 [Streptomyces sp. CB02613]SCE13264.1 hypothetical protein GA0115253_103162 [Streptomyces sp. Termitarium-T10T-6]
MTATTSSQSFFLAGTMQGARTGSNLVDQSYRAALTASIRAHRPGAVIHDPGVLMAEWEAAHPADIRAAHAELTGADTLHRSELAPELVDLTDMFHELTLLAASSDVCVAWLPGHEPSMGTAAEMLSAFRAGRTVVSITAMRQNLAVLACSTVILPDLPAFTQWLDREAAPRHVA